VTTNFFSLLGVEPQLGRTFTPEQGQALGDSTTPLPTALLLSDGFWRRRFGGDPGVRGATVQLNGGAAVILGVLPPDFRFLTPPDAGLPQDVDAWAPLPLDNRRGVRADQRVRDQDSDDTGAVVARLRPGVTLAQARGEMAAIAARQRAESEYHRNAGIQIDVFPLHEDVTGHVRPVLLALFGAVGLVLLIACLNVANLLLARGLTRQKELAVRAALGASRGRIVRQLLTESTLLGIAGAGLGVLVAMATLEALLALRPATLPHLEHVAIDGVALWFAIGATLLSVATFGSMPAYAFSRGRGADLLTTRSGHADPRRTRQVFVVAEVAVAIALLVGTGLMLRTVSTLQRVRPGFEAAGVLTFDLSLRERERYRGPADRARFVRLLEERVALLPGVEVAGLVGRLPLSGRVWTNQYGVEGQNPGEWSTNEANFRMITPSYFTAMRTTLLSGRFFTSEENLSERRRVVIIDETMAARLPAGDAIGQHVGFPLDGRPVWAEIVGVVENVRHESLMRDGRETLYVPYRHEASRDVSIVVRAHTFPDHLNGAIRGVVRTLDPELPLYDVRTMTSYVADAQADARFALTVLAVFAGIALVLSAIGLYGILSFWVSRDAHGIGVRMALGAGRTAVLRQVVARGMALVGIGIVVGFAVAAGGARLLASLVFGVALVDVTTYVTVALVVAVVSLLACYLPARRASRVDPLVALRYE
jgi:predicted permease